MSDAAVRTIESTFDSDAGPRLHRRSWLPEGPSRAKVAVVHGYAEHSGRYQWAGEQLAAAGFEVHAYDLRGHGKSEGPRVLVQSFKEHLDDLHSFLWHLHDEAPGDPPFLLGHSMGGNIAALYTVVRTPALKGLILSGPAVAKPTGPARLFGPLMGAIAKVRPAMGVRALAATTVSRDPAVVEAYDRDPLVYRGKIPAGTVAAIGRSITRIQRDMYSLACPLLILQGTADELCDASGAQALYDAAISDDKTLKLYEGLAHEVLNEPEKEQVLSDLREWLLARS